MSLVLIKNAEAFLIVRSEKHGQFKVLIDVEDAHRVAAHQWHVQKERHGVYFKTNIPVGSGKYTKIALHGLIMNAPKGIEVDHKNPNDMLDNRKSNLRLATRQQQCHNTRSRPGSESQYKGVKPIKSSSKRHARPDVWSAQIGTKVLETYDTEIDAARAYDIAALELYGEFAFLNLPDDIGKVAPVRRETSNQYRGVYQVKQTHRWIAVINVDGKNKHLGTFSSELDAATAYDKAACELGRHNRLNFSDAINILAAAA